MTQTIEATATVLPTAPHTAGPLVVLPEDPSPPAQRSIGRLAAALALAQERCQAVPRDGEVKGGRVRFRYPTTAAKLEAADAALKGTGLSLVPFSPRLKVTGSGATAVFSLLRRFVLTHTSGEYMDLGEMEWPVIPEGGMSLGKAFASMATVSLGYIYRDLLRMPDDDSDDATYHRQASAQQRAEPAPRSEPQAPTADLNGSPKEEPRPNSQAPAQAGETLTEEQIERLRGLYRKHNRKPEEWTLYLQILGCRTPDRVPQASLAWLEAALQGGLAPATQVDRIMALMDQLKVDPKSVAPRLQELYGRSSLAHLLPRQANEVEAKLKAILETQLQTTVRT